MFSWLKNDKRGFTLVEMVVSILILGIVAVTMVGVFMIARVSIVKVKHYMQVMNLLRLGMENQKNKVYGDIASVSAQPITIDIGNDAGSTSDDLVGQILVVVGDRDDLDGDGITAEAEIDIDGDSTNDSCKPIYVTISWTSHTLGVGSSSVSEELATLISE